MHYIIWASSWENPCLLGFWPGMTQTRLYKHRKWLEAWNFVFRRRGIVLSMKQKQRCWSAGRLPSNWSVPCKMQVCIWHSSYVSFFFFLFLLWFNVPVNNFSVMLRRSHLFLGITSTFLGSKCLLLKETTHRPGRGSNPGLPIRSPTL